MHENLAKNCAKLLVVFLLPVILSTGTVFAEDTSIATDTLKIAEQQELLAAARK